MRYLLLLLCIFICGCQKQSDHEKNLILGTNPAYPPYESINTAGKCEGFDIDLGEAIAQKLNKKLIIKELSFDALILAIKQKKIDCILSGMSITSKRQREIEMIPYQGEEIKTLSLIFWERPSHYSGNLTDLGPVAVQVGTHQEGYLLGLEGVKVKSLEGNAEIIMDLQHGKSAAAIFEPHIAKSLQKRFPQLHCIEIPLEEQHWVLGNGIGVKKDNLLLISQIKKAIQELKEEGFIQQLEKKWMGP